MKASITLTLIVLTQTVFTATDVDMKTVTITPLDTANGCSFQFDFEVHVSNKAHETGDPFYRTFSAYQKMSTQLDCASFLKQWDLQRASLTVVPRESSLDDGISSAIKTIPFNQFFKNSTQTKEIKIDYYNYLCYTISDVS